MHKFELKNKDIEEEFEVLMAQVQNDLKRELAPGVMKEVKQTVKWQEVDYTWEQTHKDVTVNVKFPPGVTKSDVSIQIWDTIHCRVKIGPIWTNLCDSFHSAVRTEECLWMWVDNELEIILVKEEEKDWVSLFMMQDKAFEITKEDAHEQVIQGRLEEGGVDFHDLKHEWEKEQAVQNLLHERKKAQDRGDHPVASQIERALWETGRWTGDGPMQDFSSCS